MRRSADNLLDALREGRDPWPGLHGFESTVIPQLERALLAGHDVVLLGERGQGKTRLLRTLVGLLDEWTPVIAGSELGEHPYDPITHASQRRAAELGDDLPVEWRHRDERYAEKLATPDTIGRRPDRRRRPDEGGGGPVAGRPGDHPLRPDPALPPRHRRDQRAARPRRADPGRDAQRDGGARHPDPWLRAPAAARRAGGGQRQPRGLHQPRPDHHAAQGPVRRRDPHPLPGRARGRGGRDPAGGRTWSATYRTTWSRSWPASPGALRESQSVDQRSGVSARFSIAGAETIAAAALHRATAQGETEAVARVVDLETAVDVLGGKVEFETGEEGREREILEHLLRTATAETVRHRLRGHRPRAARRRDRGGRDRSAPASR